MQRIVHDEPRSIREQNPLVPDWLELFVLRLLAKDKAARLTSAVEVVQILQAELAHLQNPRLTPAPARPWQPAPRRPTRRGRRTWMVAGAVVGIALLIAGIGFWQYLGTRSPGDDGESKNAAGPSLSGLSAPSATVPLWGVEVDGLPQAVAQADALKAAWTTPSSHGEPDAWDELAGDIRRRLAELSAELESAKSAGTSPAK
jgi:hypothetical protein